MFQFSEYPRVYCREDLHPCGHHASDPATLAVIVPRFADVVELLERWDALSVAIGIGGSGREIHLRSVFASTPYKTIRKKLGSEKQNVGTNLESNLAAEG